MRRIFSLCCAMNSQQEGALCAQGTRRRHQMDEPYRYGTAAACLRAAHARQMMTAESSRRGMVRALSSVNGHGFLT